MKDIIKEIKRAGIIPVITISDAKKAKHLAESLLEGGLFCVEVTFRTEAAKEAICVMKETCPELLVGAGTVLTIPQIEWAREAGAEFIVSPGLNPAVVEYCVERNIIILPGCITPSEIEQALCFGLNVVKFFPAELSGGLKMIQALSAPYSAIQFMPTGGINTENVKDYLKEEKIIACGGSWIAKEELIQNDQFQEITKLAKEAANLVKEARKE